MRQERHASAKDHHARGSVLLPHLREYTACGAPYAEALKRDPSVAYAMLESAGTRPARVAFER